MVEARRTTLGAALAAAALLLAGCSEDLPPKPDLPDEPVALWNPCDALDARDVERAFGTVATEENGTETAPECRFAPAARSGQPVIEVNYLLFPGGLDEAWDTMGQPHDADVSEPRIAGADDARVVVDVVEKQLYVTGFVQNGDLIQSINVVDPAPFDRQQALLGVRDVLTVLSRHASESGVTADATPSVPHG